MKRTIVIPTFERLRDAVEKGLALDNENIKALRAFEFTLPAGLEEKFADFLKIANALIPSNRSELS